LAKLEKPQPNNTPATHENERYQSMKLFIYSMTLCKLKMKKVARSELIPNTRQTSLLERGLIQLG